MPYSLAAPLALGALGAAAGGASAMLSKPAKVKRSPTMTDEQIQNANFAGNWGRNAMQNPYQGFEPIAQKAQTTFNQQTVPTLAERFTSMGSGSALSSPAFASQLGQAGQGLSTDLAAMMAQYGLQQQGQGMQALGIGLHPQFENTLMPAKQGFLGGLLGGIGQGLGGAAGSGFGAFMQQGGKGGMWGHGGFKTSPQMPYAQRHPDESNYLQQLIASMGR